MSLLSACAGDAPEPDPTPSESSPASPSAASLAVVVGPESVAGWWDGTKWVKAEERRDEIPAKAGDSYKLVGLEGEIGTAEGSAVKDGCETIQGSALIEIPGLARTFEGHVPPPVAVSGVNNPAPRKLEVLDPAGSVYRDAAAAVLREKGIDVAAPQVIQAIRADLEGDGKDEVVVVAEKLADPASLLAQIGDYSVVFVRRVVDDKPVTALVSESIPVPKENETPFVISHRVTAIADLNGDGKMEIALSQIYYEGAAVTFHELKSDGTVEEVLGSGCGA